MARVLRISVMIHSWPVLPTDHTVQERSNSTVFLVECSVLELASLVSEPCVFAISDLDVF